MYKKTASDALDEYIDHFEGRSRSKHYTRRVSDLLSPKPKFKFLDAVEKEKDGDMNNKDGKLLRWINESYEDSLRTTCVPLYAQQEQAALKSSSSTGHFPRKTENGFSYSQYGGMSNSRTGGNAADDLSTLPSPSMSDIDLDSEQDTVETEVLLKNSFERERGQDGSNWKRNKATNSMYPEWVDEVNHSAINGIDPRRLSSVSVLLKSNHSKSLRSQSRSMDTTGLTMDDAASVDTETILDTPIYGRRPVNMGGNLHAPLFKDERVESILNESRMKLKKHNKRALGRSLHGVSSMAASRHSDTIMSPESRDISYTKQILSNKHRDMYGAYANSGSFDRPNMHNQDQETAKGNVEDDRINMYGRVNSQSSHYIGSNITKSSLDNSSTNINDRKTRLQLELTSSKTGLPSSYLNARSQDERLESGKSVSRPHKDIFLLNRWSRNSDVIDVSSQRTSGYNSGHVSPYNDLGSADLIASNKEFIPRKASSPTRSRSPIKPISSFSANSNVSARKSSDSTDILLRGPPIGTKVHQRSKTWSSQSFQARVPDAMSTPKPSTAYRSPHHSTEYLSDRSRPAASSIVSSRTPPASKPHSGTGARAFASQQSPYLTSHSQRDISRRSRLSDSVIVSQQKKVDSYTNWKSSALNPVKSRQFVLREEVMTDEADVTSELEEAQIFKRGLATAEVSSGQSNVTSPTKGLHDDTADEHSSMHNRTWPSLEKFKERQSQYPFRDERLQSQPSKQTTWTAAKRSIPLLPSSVTERFSPQNSLSNQVDAGRHQISKLSISNGRQSPSSGHTTSFGVRNSSRAPSKFPGHADAYRTERYDSDDDNATIDTDLLLAQPPMPIVDASPSLSTVSDEESTVKGSGSDDSSQLFAELPARSSSRVSFAPDVSFGRMNKVSPLSKFESTNPRTASSFMIKDSIYKAVDDADQHEKFNRTLSPKSKSMRSELLDSFIEDCMRTTNGTSFAQSQPTLKRNSSSGGEQPRTVETLKHMLLNLSGISANEEKASEAEDDSDYDAQSGNTSDDAASLVGEQSLVRAYHHLERLKSLISGKVDSKGAIGAG